MPQSSSPISGTSVRARAWFLGDGTLLVRCAETWLNADHQIAGLVSSDPSIRRWAEERQLTTVESESRFLELVGRDPFDYLFSVGNHAVLSTATIQAPRRLAVNFHYGPLPAYAGVHVPVWALLHGARQYGVTWHEMTPDVDAGRIVKAAPFDVPPADTAAELNARCFEHGLQSFAALVDDITADRVTFTAQDISKRSLYKRHDRPPGHTVIDFNGSAEAIERLVRALDFGPLENAFGTPRLVVGDDAFVVTQAEPWNIKTATGSPGEVLAIGANAIVVATGTTPIELGGVRRATGERLSPAEFADAAGIAVGRQLTTVPSESAATGPVLGAAVRQEVGTGFRGSSISSRCPSRTGTGWLRPGVHERASART